jgi:phosphatidylserine/phosphatidylglycerophosphate/cardiolipin synthase-like enzyme
MRPLFTSLHGGGALRQSLLDLVEEVSSIPAAQRVDLHIMTFAFTDEAIAEALLLAADRRPSLTIRLLADWSQRNRVRGQQAGRLAALRLPNLRVRYSLDQPYVWDAEAGHMRWSYHDSRGLLHHKTLTLLVDGRPWKLACGSFNWTATAARSYENLLVMAADDAGSRALISRMEYEFEALWSDGRSTCSPEESDRHYQAILACYRRDPRIPPSQVPGLEEGAGDQLDALEPDCLGLREVREPWMGEKNVTSLSDANVAIAFSFHRWSRSPVRAGCAVVNQEQRMTLATPAGNLRLVPVTITHLALDTIFQTKPGDTIQLAMYGLSPRVPEYGALLDAARRGVRLQILLDRVAGGDAAIRLSTARDAHGLPIEVRTAGRMMHQKYLIHRETGTVVTGTANMSTDASTRHWEHRIRIGGCPRIAAQYSADFDEIWSRLASDQSRTTTGCFRSAQAADRGAPERKRGKEEDVSRPPY